MFNNPTNWVWMSRCIRLLSVAQDRRYLLLKKEQYHYLASEVISGSSGALRLFLANFWDSNPAPNCCKVGNDPAPGYAKNPWS